MLENMLRDAEEAFRYDIAISKYYIDHADIMLDEVNHQMKEKPNILELLGGNSLELMFNNHENHVQFMMNVIKYRQKEVFVHTLPWVYKAYSSKGVSYDYFIVELNSWIDAICKYIPDDVNHVFVKVYKLMLNWHHDLIKISQSDEIRSFVPEGPWTDDHDQFLKALIRGNYKEVIELCNRQLGKNDSVTDLYIGILQPVMYKVGELWAEGQITVAHEHLASSLLARVMASIYPQYVLANSTKGIAVVSAGVNEHHQIGARMVADVLESHGWNVHYLGSNVPIDELIKLVNETDPVFVSLSMTMSYHLDLLNDTIRALKNEVDNKNLKIMVGGFAFNTQAELKHSVDADAFPFDAIESCEIADMWWSERQE